jgi:hypothetical protein
VPGDDEHDDAAGGQGRRSQRQDDAEEGAEPGAAVDSRGSSSSGDAVEIGARSDGVGQQETCQRTMTPSAN